MSSQFGPYWMLRRIGHGDLAEVFVAVRNQGASPPGPVEASAAVHAAEAAARDPSELVAVKRIWREMATYDEIHRLLLAEGELAAQFTHPHVVQVFDVGTVGGRPYLAMEYVPGADLAHLLGRAAPGPLDPGCAVRIALDVCDGLAYIHDARTRDGQRLHVVHGDLTPTNILVSASGVAKLIDFSVAVVEAPPADASDPDGGGEADAAAPSLSVGERPTRTVRGTYAYMSPEQARGESVDRRTDVFALGVVLWEMFSGRRLFLRGANYLTLAAVVEEEAPALAEIGIDLGAATAEIDGILRRALAKRREDRYPDVGALAEALAPAAERAGWDLRPWALKSAVRALLSVRAS